MTKQTKYSFTFSVLFFLVIFQSSAKQQDDNKLTIYTDREEIEYLDKYLYVLEDPSNNLSFQQVISSSHKSQFKKAENIDQFKNDCTYWGRIVIENYSGYRDEWVLNIAPVGTNFIEVYYKKNDEHQYSHKKTGEYVIYDEKAQPKKRACKVRLDLSDEDLAVIYIKINNIDKTIPEFDLLLESSDKYYSSLEKRNLLIGIFVGMMGIIILYNLLIYKLHKDKTHIYYALYILSMSTLFIYEFGFALETVFKNFPVLNQFLLQLSIIAPFFFLKFISTYTKATRYFPKAIGFVQKAELVFLSMFVISLLVLAIWFDVALVKYINQAAFSAYMLVASIVVYLMLRSKKRASSFVILGTAALVGFSLVAIYLKLAWNIDHLKGFILVGFVIQVFSFSLGLGFRMKLREIEKLKEQNRLIGELKKSEQRTHVLNSQLEAKIEERGNRLNQHQKEIAFQAKELVEMNWELYEKNGELEKANDAMEVSNKKLIQKNEELNVLNNRLNNTLAKLKETQVQLIQSEKMASIGVLTAGIAHEINNPINFVYAGADTLASTLNEIMGIVDQYGKISSQNSPEEITSFLDDLERVKQEISYEETRDDVFDLLNDIKEGARRTAEIVQGLRSFSRLDEEQVKKADLHLGLESTLTLLRNKLKDGIRVIKDYDPELPSIECVPGQINQVFMNILVNAAQAIQENESEENIIEIKTVANMLVSSDDTDVEEQKIEDIEIHITDTGGGIAEEIQNRIFEPFFTTKKVGEGTGLGLSITHSIIQKHNGSIELKSDGENGTTFIITLPTTQMHDNV
ncbi:ATP-binding protein [Flammeovirgaceae bacterium SG7u.111]|nr:ATP-binding protein [Flammeovirgaceae bacterium SG7u.132]WPO33332.1 ATP-binding protein [Flammeovirgaceae bacterium SG7u.111]